MNKKIHRREDPDPWLAFQDDPNLPLDSDAKVAWIKDTSSWSRQFLMPIIRPTSRVAMAIIQLYKIIFPNALTSSILLHKIIVWGLKTFVTPEGNYLLVRHFHLGSQVLEFLKHNIEGVEIVTDPLYPPDLDAYKDNLILKHDINLYNFVIDLNRELKEKNLKITPKANFNFSDLHKPPITVGQFKRGPLNFIDIHTAIEFILPLFQVLLTDREFWRSTQSLQLDETVGLYFANLMNLHNRLILVNNRHPLVPAVTSEAGYRLVLHSISTEILHAMLMEQKAKAPMSFLIMVGIVGLAGMFGVSLGYHRYLAHKSFKPVRWFELLIIFLGLPAGTPIQWAGNHRAHHAHSDTPLDPHSPHEGGFWWAHNGWYLQTHKTWVSILYSLGGPLRSLFDGYHRPLTNQQYNDYAKDISRDPVLAWMSRPKVYFSLVLIHTLGAFIMAYLFAGLAGVLLAYVCYLYVYNVGDAVDSIGHLFGSRNPGSKHLATNNWVLGILGYGDGWHANHHDAPALARHGRGFWQIDLSYQMLRLLALFGIVSEIKEEKI